MAPKRGRGGGGAKRASLHEAKLPSFEEVDLHGVRPDAPDELFIVQGTGTHRVRRDQIVSMAATTMSQEMAEQARSIGGRMELLVNAGTPSDSNPLAGSCFHGHAFTPKLKETNESEWRPRSASPPHLAPAADSGSLQLHVSDHRYCSSADVLARYAGGEALAPSGHALFIVVFLNEGNPQFLPTPTESSTDEEQQAYMRQRTVIGRNLSKLFLVYADAVPPLLCKDRGPAMIACLATIHSDKSPGAPGGTYQSSIAGYHDRSRLHVLPLGHVQRIQALVTHYRLEKWFPALTASWSIQDWLPLAHYRTRAVDALGVPPGGVVTREWLAQRGAVPFDTPWVQHCDMTHPSGKHDSCGKPVLLPLVHGSAEERNGVPWLRLDAEDAASDHYQQVKAALARIGGSTRKKKLAGSEAEAGTKPDAEVARLRVENARLERKMEAVKAELESARHHVAEMAIECQKLTGRNMELAAALRVQEREASA